MARPRKPLAPGVERRLADRARPAEAGDGLPATLEVGKRIPPKCFPGGSRTRAVARLKCDFAHPRTVNSRIRGLKVRFAEATLHKQTPTSLAVTRAACVGSHPGTELRAMPDEVAREGCHYAV